MFKNLVGHHKPDILDCISNLSSDEVFSPPAIVNKVLDLLPAEVWSNPDIKILDPGCKSGVFLREAAKRLMDGLKEVIPDEDERREHIFRSMLYGIAITELTGLISRRSLYTSKDPSSEFSVVKMDNDQGNIHYSRGRHAYRNGKCIHCGAPEGSLDRGDELENYAYQFIHSDNVFGEDMKFDVIIGNPPYQLEDAGESTGASPIYHRFVDQAKKLAPRYISMIIPSRWFAGGKGLDDFRESMLNDKRISHLVDFHNAADCFPGVEIKGGVCYFLWDAKHNGDCEVTPVLNGEQMESAKRNLGEHDIFIRFNQSISILAKVKNRNEAPLSVKMSSQKPFGFRTNFADFKKERFIDAIEIYANKEVGWIHKDKITLNRQWVDKYKVLVSAAYNGGDSYPHQIIGRPIVAGPGSCCTETYIICSTFDTKEEAQNLEQYMKTRFFRFMVWMRKITQHNPKDRFSFVPQLDMSKQWTDEVLYARYGLDEAEVAFIESMIKEIP